MPGRMIHRTTEVIMIAYCSMLSDNVAFSDMETFSESQLKWLRTFLPLQAGFMTFFVSSYGPAPISAY